MRNHSRCLSFLLSGILSVSLLAPLSSAQAAYDGSIRNLVDRVTVLTESVQTESANEEELAKLDEMQAELEDKADAKEDVSETETVSMVVTGGTINVRTGPGTNYDKITQVVSGKQVTVVGESNGWYQVTFGSTTGWLLGEYLRDPADLDGTVGAKIVSMAMPFLGTRYRSGGAAHRKRRACEQRRELGPRWHDASRLWRAVGRGDNLIRAIEALRKGRLDL